MLHSIKNANRKNGQAALTAVIFFLAIFLTVTLGFSAMALRQASITRVNAQAVQSYFLAESGQEDAVYRLIAGKMISASETITTGTASVTTDIVQVGNTKEITSGGDADSSIRRVKTVLSENTTGVSFFYGVQVDAGGVIMGNGAQINGNLFSNGSISGGRVTGSATVATGLTVSPTAEWPTGCTSSCGDSDNFFATTTTNQDIAQSFTAPATGALTKMSVFLGKAGTPANDIALRITTDVSGHPNSSQIPNANVTIPRTSVGLTPSWLDVTFPTPPNLTNGTKYWIVLHYSANSAVNYWNWRKDGTGAYANNTGKKTTNWSSGSAVWVDIGGDLAFRTWIGGINNQITNATIDGAARAPAFVNDTVSGSACPPTGPNCIIASDSPQSLPISDGVLQDFRDDATAGGTVGDQNISGTVSLGPKKINGDLSISNGATLVVTGTLWVTGQFQTSNNSTVKLNATYGTNSGVIIGDGSISISNNTTLSGSGQAGSYIMVMAAKNTPSSQVLDVSNNSAGAIYYAPHGRIHFNNNATAKEVIGYGFDLDNNATVTYESGLANVNFSSGPNGGYDIINWKEVE